MTGRQVIRVLLLSGHRRMDLEALRPVFLRRYCVGPGRNHIECSCGLVAIGDLSLRIFGRIVCIHSDRCFLYVQAGCVGTDISANRLVGVVCIYLILGVIWAVAYSILEMTFPGSFQGFVPLEDREWDSEWLYFSFVTMATLGYGDIAPVSATARALAYLEAVSGQFYIAILVAGLVRVHISHTCCLPEHHGPCGS
jgi:hypothetical protein